RHAARLDDDFLEGLRVEAEDAQRLLVLIQAFDVRTEVRTTLAVNSELAAFTLIAADILEGWIGVGRSRDNRSILAEPLRGGDGIQRVARDRCLLSRALSIDNGGLTQNGHRLFERSRIHLGVDRRRERRRQLDAFPLEGAKTGQRERDAVGTGP